jgi:hypothetical protein
MRARDFVRLYLPATLFAVATIWTIFGAAAAAPGLGLMAIGYAIPFTRRQFQATGRKALQLVYVAYVLKMVGLALLAAAVAGSPVGAPFWIVLGVVLAIFLPGWLWGARVFLAEPFGDSRPLGRLKGGAR